jgi:hypothetical protein
MNNTIKVIKREQRENKGGTAKTEAGDGQSLRHATREVAGNVAAWVREFQQRRTPNPRRAFASLFIEPASSLNSPA